MKSKLQFPDVWEVVGHSAPKIEEFFKNSLIGCGGKLYASLYLDTHGFLLFINDDPDPNTRIQRKDGSLFFLIGDSGYGKNVSEKERIRLVHRELQDFGFENWLDNTLEPAINKALAAWKARSEQS